MVDISDPNCAGARLLLEMALQTERLVSFVQHSLIHRSVWRMADDATLADSFVLINEWPALRGMTLHAGVVHAQKGEPAGAGCSLTHAAC